MAVRAVYESHDWTSAVSTNTIFANAAGFRVWNITIKSYNHRVLKAVTCKILDNYTCALCAHCVVTPPFGSIIEDRKDEHTDAVVRRI